MKNNLYKEFNCNSKEELYEKIKNQYDEVKPLIEFLDYATANIKNSRKAINSPDVFVDYVKSITLPTKDTGTIIFTNIKNHPVHIKRTRLSWKNSIKETMKEGLMAGATNVFLAFSNDTSSKTKEKIKEYFEKIGIKIIDTIGYSKENKSFISKMAGRSYYSTKTYEIASDSENAYGEKDYSLKDKYEDFTSYFASNELIDLNVVENAEEIKEVLKIGFQHHQQEIFGVLIYDSNEKIIGAEELFKGATDAAIVDLKIIARTLFNYQDVKGMAVFHNHPSGNPNPSREDIEMTKKIKNITEIVEIELLDHFVIGKEKTLSFSQEVSDFQSENLIYQDKLEQMPIIKEDKSIYNREKFILKVQDRIKTGPSDETIVFDIDKDNIVLFDGREFVGIHGIESDVVDFYPIEKLFNNIDLIDSVESTNTSLFKLEKVMDEKSYNKERKKESTIVKLNKFKDRQAKNSIGISQERSENKKNDREM